MTAETDYGQLVIAVKTAGGALPVENAVVTVKDGSGEIISIFFTDRNGRTPKLKLLAPPIANSEAPNQAGPAFFTYNVDTDREGYISVRNIGVPIYPGITSIQPVELVPVSEGSSEFYNDVTSFNESQAPEL